MEDKKYFWIKLKTDFFNEDGPVDFLLGQKNGSEYVVLYIKLCLATANSDGMFKRKIGEIIVPYDVDKITRDMKYFSRDTVIVALELYKKLGLVYTMEDNVLAITDFDNLVGSETKYAEKKRKYRKAIKEKEIKTLEDKNGDIVKDKNGDNVGDNVRQEYRDKSIEYRDKSKDIRDKKLDIKENKDLLEEKKSKKEKVFYPNDEKLNEAFTEFVKMRKLIKAPMTDRAIDLAISQLTKLSGGDNDQAIKIIDQSIRNSWKGLFPLKQERTRSGGIDWDSV